MYLAEQLKKKSVAEYLLYMWQVEDTLRAFDLDVERMAREYIPQFGLDAEKSEALRGWYESLIEMMREEGVTEKGHLQVNKNIIILLNDLHVQLLKSSKHPFYSAAYYKALPFIVELRAKQKKKTLSALKGISPVEGETMRDVRGGGDPLCPEGHLPREGGDHAGCEGEKGEIENCFDALYGTMLLRAQKKEISPETATAIDNIAKFIALLSDYYQKDKAGEVEF